MNVESPQEQAGGPRPRLLPELLPVVFGESSDGAEALAPPVLPELPGAPLPPLPPGAKPLLTPSAAGAAQELEQQLLTAFPTISAAGAAQECGDGSDDVSPSANDKGGKKEKDSAGNRASILAVRDGDAEEDQRRGSFHVKDPKDYWESLTEMRHVEFTIRGYSGVKKAVFLPPGMLGTVETTRNILTHWKLTKANVLLEIGDNGVHPEDFLTDAMIESAEDFKPYRDLYDMTADGGLIDARLILLRKGDPDACRFTHFQALKDTAKDGQTVPLVLSSHPNTAIVLQDGCEQFGPWNVQGLCAGDPERAVHVKFFKNEFIMDLTGRVLDICGWTYHAGAACSLLKGDETENGQTLAADGGRSFVINDDGTVSPTKDHKFVLGLQRDTGVPDSGTEHGRKHVLNKILHDRLVRMVGSVAVALESSNSWFFSRAGTWVQGSHLLVERAIHHSRSSPNVLVLDDPFPSPNSREKIPVFTDDMARLYNIELSRRLFVSAKKLRTAFGDPIELDPGVGLTTCDDIERAGALQPKWCFGSGTHYIFAPDCGSFDPLHFATMPPGLFACGGDGAPPDYVPARDQILHAMESQLPLIIMKHTSAVAHDFSELLANLVPHNSPTFTADVAKLWKRVHEVSRQKWVKLSDAFRVMELNRLYPRLFVDTVIVVNPMQDTPEQVLKKISGCFTSAGRPDPGAGDADKFTVVCAWQQHRLLHVNVIKQRAKDVSFIFLSLFLTFIALTTAIVVTYLERIGRSKDSSSPEITELVNSEGWVHAKYLVLVLQAMNGLLNTYLLSMSYNHKWASLYLARAQMIAEIYRFRSRIGQYALDSDTASQKKSGQPGTGNVDEDLTIAKVERSNNLSTLAKNARMLFVKRVQDIVKDVSEGQMSTHAFGNAVSGHSAETGMHVDELKAYVQHAVYSIPQRQCGNRMEVYAPLRMGSFTGLPKLQAPSRCFGARARQEQANWPDDEEQPRGEGHADGDHMDELTGSVATEGYVSCRIVPMRELLTKEALALEWRYNSLQLLLLIFEAVATLMAAVDAITWVPVAISVGSSIRTIMEHFRLKQRLIATNSCVSTLSQTLMFWNSLGILDRRVHSTRDRVVATTEDAILQAASATCGIVPKSQNAISETESTSDPHSKKRA